MDIQQKAYCNKCHIIRPYKIEESTQPVSIRSVHFLYPELSAVCCKCGEKVYSPQITDHNIYARHKAYYEKVNKMKGVKSNVQN